MFQIPENEAEMLFMTLRYSCDHGILKLDKVDRYILNRAIPKQVRALMLKTKEEYAESQDMWL